MKLKKTITLGVMVAALLAFTSTYAQTKPVSAGEIVKEAKAIAAKSHKNVFIMFHASWCVWCHRMDTAMNDPKIKSFFDDHYVIRHITIDESKDKKDLENPGGNELRTLYHGDEQGIPYWFILNKDGNLLADSRIINEQGKQGNNVGCPAEPSEVNYFIQVLKKTSSLNDAELELIHERFLKNKG
ncbi:MAG: thioredoxin family protein [Ginsengibacter sp.]